MEKLLDYLMKRIEQKEPLKPGYHEYIRYGLEVLLSTLLNVICIGVVGVLMNKILLALVFILVFVPIRSFAGGYHADTKLRCNLNIIVVLIVTMVGTDWIRRWSLELIFLMVGNLVFFILFSILAPVEHHNKPLDQEKRRRNKRLGWFSYGIVLITQIITYRYAQEVSVYISVVLLVIGVFFVLGYWKTYLYKKRERNDTNCNM